MGFPHPTVDVPGHWPAIVEELRHLAVSPLVDELRRGLDGGPVTPGHVCATAFIVTPERSELLLVRHRRLGWSNPGGHLEQHETTRDAVLREVREETGLAAPRLVLGHPVAVHVTDVGGDRPHRHWNVAWVVECPRDTPLRPEDGAPVGWFGVDDLPLDGAPDLAATWRTVSAALAQ